MNVFRIHIRPSGGCNDSAYSFAYCLQEGVLGVGWQVPVQQGASLAWEAYLDRAAEIHGEKDLSRVRYLHDCVQPGDLIWTRNAEGRYYLAKVEAPWEYLDTPEGRKADIVNVVRCRIVEIPHVDDVPGKVVACFRPPRAIQMITDPTATFYSRWLWSHSAGESFPPLSNSTDLDIFSLLDDETTEDVIFIYLQHKGWIVIPNSRKLDTMRYEFLAIHRETFERSVVQVKTGCTQLPVDSWFDFREKVFLFQSQNLYTGTATPNVIPIPPGEIRDFMSSHSQLMPRFVQRWMKYAQSGGQPNTAEELSYNH